MLAVSLATVAFAGRGKPKDRDAVPTVGRTGRNIEVDKYFITVCDACEDMKGTLLLNGMEPHDDACDKKSCKRVFGTIGKHNVHRGCV